MATKIVPRQKSADLPSFLSRVLPAWVSPLWTDAQRWRQVVRNQPVSIICRDRLITYAQALPWDVRAKDLKEQDKLEEDIKYYKEFVLRDFDLLLDLLWQDALDLPIGGNAELVRFPAGAVPPAIDHEGEKYKVTRPHPRGHVAKVVHIDGATMAPTYDLTFPYMQRPPESMAQPILFKSQEIGRVVLTPRTELMMKGFGMPPPQRVFLAISLLYRGDQYYANLLLDTPPAGILDLMDMSQASATEWLSGYKSLLEGIDPLKVGVLYEHEKPINFVSFGKPPTEMMFNDTTLKYARIMAAGYWLTLEDIGLEPGGKTLAGTVRRQRELRQTGFGMIREKTRNFINKSVLPPYLEFDWQERDDEAIAATGRARLLNAQALKAMIDGSMVTSAEAQEQLVRDGLLTVEVEEPEEKEEMPPQLPPGGQNGTPRPQEAQDQAPNERDRVPESQGGRGQAGQTARAGLDIGDETISAAPTDAKPFGQMESAMRRQFGQLRVSMADVRLRKLIKAAARLQFPVTSKALFKMPESMFATWGTQRSLAWRGEASAFDGVPDVQKSDEAIIKALEEILAGDLWWQIPEEAIEALVEPLKAAFSEGAALAAQDIVRLLYEENVLPSPDPIGFNFELKNQITLDELTADGASLVRHVNDGTKTFLRRAITSGVDAGLSSQEIALRIQEGQELDAILKQTGFLDSVARVARQQIEGMLDSRVASIVNTEINRAETEGRRQQWKHMGLAKKAWAHTGPDTPCPVCTANIERGLIDIDAKFDSVFGSEDVNGPPGHPGVCHCHLEFDEKELLAKAGTVDISLWAGN